MNQEHHNNHELSDEAVAQAVQQGDGEQFGVLMFRYEEKLSRYGRKFLSQKTSIEDIVQDVFISAYQNINSFNTSLKFSSWIYRIAHNAFVNALKKKQYSALTLFDFDTILAHHVYEDPIEGEREQAEIKKLIDHGLSTLQTKYREVLILHYIEELGYQEISDILHIPKGTVGIRIKRAKESLRKTLTPQAL